MAHVLMDFSRTTNKPPTISRPQLQREAEPVVPERPLPTREELQSAALDLVTNIVRLNGFHTNQNQSWPLQNQTPPTKLANNPGIHSPDNRRHGWSPSPTSVEMAEFGSPVPLLGSFRGR